MKLGEEMGDLENAVFKRFLIFSNIIINIAMEG